MTTVSCCALSHFYHVSSQCLRMDEVQPSGGTPNMTSSSLTQRAIKSSAEIGCSAGTAVVEVDVESDSALRQNLAFGCTCKVCTCARGNTQAGGSIQLATPPSTSFIFYFQPRLGGNGLFLVPEVQKK